MSIMWFSQLDHKLLGGAMSPAFPYIPMASTVVLDTPTHSITALPFTD